MAGADRRRRRREPGRLAGALGISVLVHLALLLLILVTWPHLETWPGTEVTEVVLAPRHPERPRARRVPAPASRPAHRAPTAHPPRVRPVPARPAPTAPAPPAAPAPRAATSPRPAPPPPTAGTRASPPARAATPIRAAPTPPTASATPPRTAPPPSPQGTRPPATRAPGNDRPLDLFAPGALDRATATRAQLSADPDALAKARITRRIHDYIAELKARDRVENGLVDPYFGRLRDRLARDFKPTWTQFDPAHAQGLGNAVVAWLKDWQATASRYGLTGSPYEPGETYTGPIGPGDLPEAGNIGKSDSRVLMRQLAQIHDYLRDAVHGKAAGMQLLAFVKVTQSEDGRLLHVELTHPSGADGYDAYVVRSVKKALEGRLPPRRRGTGLGLRHHHIVSLWAFRTRFVVVPPVPGVGCDIGTNLDRLGKCYYPLEKVVWPHLQLLAVY